MKTVNIFFLTIIFFYSNLLAQNAPYPLSGFPIVIDSLNFAASQPVVADIDEDGSEDIIVSKNSPPFLIFVYNLFGELLNGWPQSVDNGTFRIAAGDINGDGHIDIIVRTAISVYVFKRNGTIMEGWPVQFANEWDYFGKRYITLYDFHNNNTLDIVNTTYNRVEVYHNDGTIHSGWPKSLPGKFALFPAIGDINNDGNAEIVIGSFRGEPQNTNDSGWLHVLSINGNQLPGWPKLLDSNYIVSTSPTLCNINSDDSIEIIIQSAHKITSFNFISRINVFSPSGKIINYWYNPSSENFKEFGEITVGDVNRSRNIDFVVSDRSYNHYIFNLDGSIFPNWPINNLYQELPPLLVDITNDSIPELVMGYYAGPLDSGRFHFYNIYAQELPWSPLIVYGATALNPPVFSDMNNDGSVEMVYVGQLGAFQISGYALSVYRFPNSLFSREGSPWPQLEHDRHNTYQYGYIPSDNIVGVPTSEENIPSAFSLAQNYPNPFNPKTTIHYTLSTAALVTLKVYDVLGREIATLFNNENKDAGKFEVQFDASNVSSGIYFYRLSVTQLGKLRYTETKKFVVMK